LQDEKPNKTKACEILDTYIRTGAKEQVNICGDARNDAIHTVEEILTTCDSVPSNVFAEVKKELFVVMFQDIWPKFLVNKDQDGKENLENTTTIPNETQLWWVQKLKYYSKDRYRAEKEKGWPDIFILTSYIVTKEPTATKVLKKVLKQNTEDVNSANLQGSTALHIAAHYGHEKAVRLLLNFGANKALINNFGDTPLSLAQKSGKKTVISLLSDGKPYSKSFRFNIPLLHKRSSAKNSTVNNA